MDNIRPAHYRAGTIEPIDAIEDWQLNFNRGNVIKYVARAGKKDSELEDLIKARFYIEREIERLSNTSEESKVLWGKIVKE